MGHCLVRGLDGPVGFGEWGSCKLEGRGFCLVWRDRIFGIL